MRLLCASNRLIDRAELLAALGDAGFVVDPVMNLDAAQEALASRLYHAAIIGAGARSDSAVRWIRHRRGERLAVPLLLQTDSDAAEARIAAFEAGADDCFRLPIAARELVARIRAVVRQGPLVPPAPPADLPQLFWLNETPARPVPVGDRLPPGSLAGAGPDSPGHDRRVVELNAAWLRNAARSAQSAPITPFAGRTEDGGVAARRLAARGEPGPRGETGRLPRPGWPDPTGRSH